MNKGIVSYSKRKYIREEKEEEKEISNTYRRQDLERSKHTYLTETIKFYNRLNNIKETEWQTLGNIKN